MHETPEKALEKFLNTTQLQAVFCNKDYTPFSKKRDQAIYDWCTKKNIPFFSYHDILLHNPEAIKTSTQTPYKIFSAYYKKSSTQKVSEPQQVPFSALSKKPKNVTTLSAPQIQNFFTYNTNILIHGGRKKSAKILNSLQNWKDYEQTHNYPELPTTTLSAYIKFGTHSLREIYKVAIQTLGFQHPLIRQLYWHDFFTQIANYFPHVFGQAFYTKYNKLTWSRSTKNFKLWCTGKTGFPIVDAGMRELNQTGFMHNRVRMITASFLTKDLHISWLWGEKYFAQKLIDYDPAVNNGNWQWVASTGCDRQPYFRIFNPWTQQKKFDPKCTYIQRWIPELKNLTAKEIHTWYKNNTKKINYPLPIVNHAQEAKKTLELYKSIA